VKARLSRKKEKHNGKEEKGTASKNRKYSWTVGTKSRKKNGETQGKWDTKEPTTKPNKTRIESEESKNRGSHS